MTKCSSCDEEITAGLERSCNYCNDVVCTKCRLPEAHDCPGLRSPTAFDDGEISSPKEFLQRVGIASADTVDVDKVKRQTNDREADYSGPDINPDGSLKSGTSKYDANSTESKTLSIPSWLPSRIGIFLWSRSLTRIVGIALLTIATYNVGTTVALTTPPVQIYRTFAATVLDPSLGAQTITWIADIAVAVIGFIVYMWR